MEKNKTILSKIMALLSIEVKLSKMTLDNGDEIEAENFEAGSEISKVTADGKTPLTAGTYTTDAGDTIVVEQDGVIASFTAKQEMADEPGTTATAETPTSEEIVKAVVDVIQPMFDDLQSQIDALTKGVETNKETLSKVVSPEIVKDVKKATAHVARLSKNNSSSTEARILEALYN